MTPQHLHELAERLVTANNGHALPTATQLVAQLLHVMPEHVTRHPNSRAFRAQAYRYAAEHPGALVLVPTRAEVNAAVRTLHRLGMLPEHVTVGREVTR